LVLVGLIFLGDFGCLLFQTSKINIIKENQAAQTKVQELENKNRGLTIANQDLTAKLAEQEELLGSCQEKVVKAEELEAKYNELEFNYRIETQNFKVANNTIRGYFAKEVEDLKQKLQASRKQKDENCELFVNLQVKKRELKNIVKSKLEDNNLLKNLLTNQELLTSLPIENSCQRTFKLLEKQLQQAKAQLQNPLTEEEIQQNCDSVGLILEN